MRAHSDQTALRASDRATCEYRDGSRAVLWIGLGLLWVFDGVLLARPAMFTRQFVDQVLLPASQGVPAWLAPAMTMSAALWLRQPILADATAVIIQIGIGILLIAGRERRLGRLGLLASIVWGLSIWVFGEGLGGSFAGPVNIFSGAPGPVLLYVVGAVLLLIPVQRAANGGGAIVGRVLGVFWLIMAALEAWPVAGFWTGRPLGMLFASLAATPQPPVLAAPIQLISAAAFAAPALCNACFVAIMALLGWAFLSGRLRRVTFVLAGAWLLFLWWLGQDFGGLFTGTATDPDTALPLAVLLLATASARSGRTAQALRSAVAKAG